MLNAYYFNFKRGYISPAGTAKFNHRYVGIPAPKLYAPVILGSAYSPYDLVEHTKTILGSAYSPYDLVEHTKTILGSAYSPYDLVGHTEAIPGSAYSIYDLVEHTEAITASAYGSKDPFFKEVNNEVEL